MSYDPQPFNCPLMGEPGREVVLLPPVVAPGEGCPGCRRVGSEGVAGKGGLDPGLLLASCVTQVKMMMRAAIVPAHCAWP